MSLVLLGPIYVIGVRYAAGLPLELELMCNISIGSVFYDIFMCFCNFEQTHLLLLSLSSVRQTDLYYAMSHILC